MTIVIKGNCSIELLRGTGYNVQEGKGAYGVLFWIDQLLLTLCCCTLAFFSAQGAMVVFAWLCAVTLCALCAYSESPRILCVGTCAYCVLGIAFTPYALFLPLLTYQIMDSEHLWLLIPCAVMLLIQMTRLPLLALLLTALFCAVACLIRRRSDVVVHTRQSLWNLRDESTEMAMHLAEKNKDLMEKQEYEVHLATLGERNRIAREIHDNVGHMLSSAILQVGALRAVNLQHSLKEPLQMLSQTLSEAMDSIRNSVHDLHDDSIDLHVQLQTIAQRFTFCPLTMDDGIRGQVEKDVRYCLIMVVKEALSNIVKHSNATHVRVVLREHPALYQLIVEDNGTQLEQCAAPGLGLRNMQERVQALRGQFHIQKDRGFRIFVSLPKGGATSCASES